MSFLEAMKASGFKAEKSTEGEFKPKKGVYRVQFVNAETLKSEKTQQEQLKVEFKIVETLDGDAAGNSKFNEFKKYLAMEGEDAVSKKKGMPWIVNALFTAGYEVVGNSDAEIIESIKGALGTDLYVKAYGFKPEDSERAYQMFNVMKEEVATKGK